MRERKAKSVFETIAHRNEPPANEQQVCTGPISGEKKVLIKRLKG